MDAAGLEEIEHKESWLHWSMDKHLSHFFNYLFSAAFSQLDSCLRVSASFPHKLLAEEILRGQFRL